MHVWVVVLGEFGRSPRMQYHALSLSRQPSVSVSVLALPGAAPVPALATAANVHFTPLPAPPAWLARVPRLLALALKAAHQLLVLLWLMLVVVRAPDVILLQTPPAIPTMAACWLAALRHRARLVLDWHNLGYTLLGLSLGAGHWLVRVARAVEAFWGRRAHGHLCVTQAMQADLQAKWGIRATVLYDQPPSFFRRTDAQTAHQLFTRLAPALADPAFAADFLPAWHAAHELEQGRGTIATTTAAATAARATSTCTAATTATTATTTTIACTADTAATTKQPAARGPRASPPSSQPPLQGAGGAEWRRDRPAIVVSSTSWTPDEDFSVLLEAAVAYDRRASQPHAAPHLPDVLFLITGRGQQKDMYLARLRAMAFQRVAFRALWLEAADYPALLGAADVGVSLHASSSGLDLPMKVVDMFGSGLPVCALAYSCISELVHEGETGLLFTSPEQLAAHLASLLQGFPHAPSALLQRLRAGVAARQHIRWEGNWERVAWPVLSRGGT